MFFKRILDINLPKGQSAFLWGARKTGKSSFLKQAFPQSRVYDLLKADLHRQLMARPESLREELSALSPEVLSQPVIIDEVQKVPALLDEIHGLIENMGIGFILCGSSARKLKRGAANLLGGRAWRFSFFPLCFPEVPDLDLLRALNHGLLPEHYLSHQPKRSLRAYVLDYLKEEIQAESLVRNLPGFTRFLDIVAFTNAEMVNYTNIARDCAIDAKTIKNYYEILVDTWIGYLVFPFSKRVTRDIVSSTPKFYLFDVGVSHYLQRLSIEALRGEAAGKAFEHFILMEIMAFHGLNEQDTPVHYWRSQAGLEVDFVLADGAVAIEVKITEHPSQKDLQGLKAFCQDYQPKHALLVCTVSSPRRVTLSQERFIDIVPWKIFCEGLWSRRYL